MVIMYITGGKTSRDNPQPMAFNKMEAQGSTTRWKWVL